jgi:hypothetical protein
VRILGLVPSGESRTPGRGEEVTDFAAIGARDETTWPSAVSYQVSAIASEPNILDAAGVKFLG